MKNIPKNSVKLINLTIFFCPGHFLNYLAHCVSPQPKATLMAFFKIRLYERPCTTSRCQAGPKIWSVTKAEKTITLIPNNIERFEKATHGEAKAALIQIKAIP